MRVLLPVFEAVDISVFTSTSQWGEGGVFSSFKRSQVIFIFLIRLHRDEKNDKVTSANFDVSIYK